VEGSEILGLRETISRRMRLKKAVMVTSKSRWGKQTSLDAGNGDHMRLLVSNMSYIIQTLRSAGKQK
jgi:hypothetical protein